jgi:hypothetical protein
VSAGDLLGRPALEGDATVDDGGGVVGSDVHAAAVAAVKSTATLPGKARKRRILPSKNLVFTMNANLWNRDCAAAEPAGDCGWGIADRCAIHLRHQAVQPGMTHAYLPMSD